jgi:hypothetical protein
VKLAAVDDVTDGRVCTWQQRQDIWEGRCGRVLPIDVEGIRYRLCNVTLVVHHQHNRGWAVSVTWYGDTGHSRKAIYRDDPVYLSPQEAARHGMWAVLAWSVDKPSVYMESISELSRSSLPPDDWSCKRCNPPVPVSDLYSMYLDQQ